MQENQFENVPVGVQNKKKKGKKKIIIIVAVCVVFLILVIVGIGKIASNVTSAMQEQMEMLAGDSEDLYKVEKQDIEQEITTSGTVVGVDVLAYTSPVTAKVKDICVEVGQTVEKGDVLLKYDPTELGDDLEKVKIQAQSDRAMGNESFEQANKAANKAYKARQQAKELKAEIQELQSDIKTLNEKIEKYEEKMEQVSAPIIPEPVVDEENQEEDFEDTEEDIQEENAGLTPEEEKDYKKALTSLSEKTECLATKQAELAEQESIALANEDITVSESTKAQVNAANRLSDMNVNRAEESYAAAEAGIVAKKKGIISSIDVIKGSYASETQTLFTVIDAKKIGVDFLISKSDLGSIQTGQKVRVVASGHEYHGTVEFISRVANDESMSGNSTGGQIKGRVLLDDPDDNIFIGVEAKVYIYIGKAEKALGIPYSSLCSDIDGDYVYIVNDENLIERKDVKIGICSDEYYEVTEGIEEGDRVITKVTSSMKPGEVYVGTNPMVQGMN